MEESVRKLLEAGNQADILGRIENLLLLITTLLIAIAILSFLRLRKEANAASEQDADWQQEVEQAYHKADYETALDILETAALLFPGSALVRYWRGRCYFQMEDWEKAASTFEDLLRSEPVYRQSVRDYMAFIEVNELVPGVEGYKHTGD